MASKKLTYSEAVAEIEQILSRLKSEQTDVDKLSAEVKRATELIAQCKARLTEVEATVKAQLSEE
ncbi:MAG: exodeoxyribonuclease VII small subunit [Alistipes sp.]|nr:exodeoxyribonuclease VII small subunit [Alistipes sp.]MBR5812308.1 exodeoxyribonuclease VII small subunit [Alistipes sp.]